MNIIACVKQVPDTEAQIKVKADGSGIEEGQIKWVMNPYDEFGVEEALKLKEKMAAMSQSFASAPREPWKRFGRLWPWVRIRVCTSAIPLLTRPMRLL